MTCKCGCDARASLARDINRLAFAAWRLNRDDKLRYRVIVRDKPPVDPDTQAAWVRRMRTGTM